MSFADDIKAISERTLKLASDNTNKIVSDLFTQVVVRSPSPSNPGHYAKGLLVNQYYTQVGEGYSSAVSSSTSLSGSDSLQRINDTLASSPFLGKDNTVTLANNTEEAYYADKLGWVKGQGTNGWIWKGTVPYMMTHGAISYIQNKYT